MRKLLLIVTLSLGTFALAQTSNSGIGMQSAGNDWYNQQLSAQVQQFQRIAAAIPSTTQPENQAGTLPGSIAANAGQAGNDWYNQVLGQQVQEFDRINATLRPMTLGQ